MFSLRRFISAVKAMGEVEKILPVSVTRLDLRDGDIVVLRLKVPMSMENVVNLNEAWVREFPNIKSIILDCNVDISTLRGKDLSPLQHGAVH